MTTITPQTLISALEKIGIKQYPSSTDPYLTYDSETNKNNFILSLPEVHPYKGKRKEYLQEIAEKLQKVKIPAEYRKKEKPNESSQGSIKFPNSKIIIEAKFTKTGLKPSDVSPSITNAWMKPEDMVKNVKKYIQTIDLDVKQKEQIEKFLDDTIGSTTKTVEVNGEVLVPAEFFEILSAIKMAVLLRANDSRLKEVLNCEHLRFNKSSPLKIYIPQKANYPLTDYEISYLPETKVSLDKQPTFKISVKSKVKSAKANTVKFKDLFTSTGDVKNWFSTINSADRMEELGPATVASIAMKFYQRGEGQKKMDRVVIASAGEYYGKVKLLFGIFATLTIIKMPALYSKVSASIKQKYEIKGTNGTRKLNDKEIKEFADALDYVYKKLKYGSYNMSTKLESLFDDKVESKKKYNLLKNIISTNKKSRTGLVEIDIKNLVLICESVLELTSRKTSAAKFNYFRMFYDKVLLQKKIAYAVTSKEKKGTSNSEKTVIKFSFYTNINWKQEYSDWIALRSKDEKDMIGLDV